MVYLVKLVLAGMCLAHVTDAASIRKNTKAAAQLDAASVLQVQSLASRYNCSDGSESLVTTLMRVTLENEAANASLVQKCQEAQDDIAAHLQEMLAAADKMEHEEAPAAGLAVYNEAMKVADEALSGIADTHSGLVATAATAAEDARVKMEEAFELREAAVKAKDEAQDVYQALLTELEEYLKAHTTALDQTRSVVIEEAKKTLDRELENAANIKEASFLSCQHTYDERMALVTKDEETIENEIKPLLEQLMSCEATSFLEMSSAKNDVHGRTRGGDKAKGKKKGKCSAVKSKLKAKMLLLETSSMRASAAETPAQEVTGNMDEWAKRVEDEKTEAAAVLKTCQDEATHILDETTEKLNAVYAAAETEADKLHSESLEKVTKEQEDQKTAGKAAADATLDPAAKAEADYDAAKMTFDEKDAAHSAAQTAQEDALTKGQEAHAVAEEEARQAQLVAEKPIKDDADALRAVSQEDADQKAANKKAECDSEMASLQADLDVIAEIQEKMSTLTTVDTDILGAKAEADAADFADCTANCHHGICEKATEDAKYHCECNAGYSGSTCDVAATA